MARSLFLKFFTRFSCVFFFFFSQALEAAQVDWTGDANDHGVWNNPSNWNPLGPPSPTDTAFFSVTLSSNFPQSITAPLDVQIVQGLSLYGDSQGTLSMIALPSQLSISNVLSGPLITSVKGNNTIHGRVSVINPSHGLIEVSDGSLTFSGVAPTSDIQFGLEFYVTSLSIEGSGVLKINNSAAWRSGAFSDTSLTISGALEVGSLLSLGEFRNQPLTDPVYPVSLTMEGVSRLVIAVDSFTITNIPIILSGSMQTIETTTGVTATIWHPISESSLSKTLTKDGPGTLILKGVNTYSGGTTVSQGTLSITENGQLGNSSAILTIKGEGTLQAGKNLTLPSTRLINLEGTNASIDTNGYNVTISGSISGIGGHLTKTGKGTLVLTGANNYSKGTTVARGSLSGFTPSSLQGDIIINGGAEVIFDQTSSGTYDGVLSGLGSITKTGGATLTLSGASSYSGGTTVSNGVLSISSDNNLGSPSGNLTVDASAILEMTGTSCTLAQEREVVLNGGTGIVLVDDQASIFGKITGSGKLEKTGIGTLAITGSNTYSGGTLVSIGTLQGDTTGLHGAITVTLGTSLVFSQTGSGTYSGTLSGSGALGVALGDITMTGGGSLSGTTTIESGAQLRMNGSLASSFFTVNGGGILTGTGTVGQITNAGQVIPGSGGTGTLKVSGDYHPSSGEIVTNLNPTSTALLAVTGTATLTDGTSRIQLSPGFYGFTLNRTILTAENVIAPFKNIILDSRLRGSFGTLDGLIYHPQSIQLLAQVIQPFLDFPYANANERATGENLDAIILAGQDSEALIFTVNEMEGLRIEQINDALDQMHPAAQGALSELQVALGSQLLSSLHRLQRLPCFSEQSSRFWAQGFGNWLDLKKQGMQIGFDATTSGVVVGYDHQFLNFWTVGLAGAYSKTDLKWSLNRGYSSVKGGYGCLYTDFALGRFFLGSSGYIGKDFYATNRQIHFSTVDLQAESSPHGFDAGAQMMMAYFLGTPSFALYPYASLDYLYLETSSFEERGAGSLNLQVNAYESQTLRAAAGGTLRFSDRNRDDSFCIAPLISLGYVLEMPVHRDHYRAKFSGVTIPFRTRGWDMAWQLFNLKFGLEIAYKRFTLTGEYIADISPEGNTPYLNQRMNAQCRWAF